MSLEHVIVYAIAPIMAVMLLGYAAGRRGAFGGDDAKRFNKVVLGYALPAALFVSIARADREMLVADMKLALVALAALMGCFMLVYAVFLRCFKNNTRADAAVSALISGSPSIGFLGFAVLEPVYGSTPEVGLVVAIVGIVVNAVGIPVGLALVNSSEPQAAGKKASGWRPVARALSQPVAWAPLLAVALVACGVEWPAWAAPPFDLIKGANASLAVFSAGITLSAVRFSIDWQVALGSVMKLIVMPAVVLGAGLLAKMDAHNLQMLVLASVLPPAFSGIIIADEYDAYVATGTSSLTLSMVLFAGFCPLWIWAADACCKALL